MIYISIYNWFSRERYMLTDLSRVVAYFPRPTISDNLEELQSYKEMTEVENIVYDEFACRI